VQINSFYQHVTISPGNKLSVLVIYRTNWLVKNFEIKPKVGGDVLVFWFGLRLSGRLVFAERQVKKPHSCDDD